MQLDFRDEKTSASLFKFDIIDICGIIVNSPHGVLNHQALNFTYHIAPVVGETHVDVRLAAFTPPSDRFLFCAGNEFLQHMFNYSLYASGIFTVVNLFNEPQRRRFTKTWCFSPERL
jgi:hypothetical protein